MTKDNDDKYEQHIPTEGITDDTNTREGQLISAHTSPRPSRHLSLQLQKYLVGVIYPARKSELLDYAITKGAEPELLDALRKLPRKTYESEDEVHDELASLP